MLCPLLLCVQVGYIYLTDPLRLQQLMLHLGLGGTS